MDINHRCFSWLSKLRNRPIQKNEALQWCKDTAKDDRINQLSREIDEITEERKRFDLAVDVKSRELGTTESKRCRAENQLAEVIVASKAKNQILDEQLARLAAFRVEPAAMKSTNVASLPHDYSRVPRSVLDLDELKVEASKRHGMVCEGC